MQYKEGNKVIVINKGKESKEELPKNKYPGLSDMICYLRGHRWYRVDIEGFVMYGRICKCCKTVLYPHFQDVPMHAPIVVYKDKISSASDAKIYISGSTMEKLTQYKPLGWIR